MTLNEAKELKQGQNIFYKNVDCFPEQVEVSSIKYNNDGKIEIHLVDNCYIPERDIENYIFLTFDECKKSCEKTFNEKLKKLKEMLLKDSSY